MIAVVIFDTAIGINHATSKAMHSDHAWSPSIVDLMEFHCVQSTVDQLLLYSPLHGGNKDAFAMNFWQVEEL